MILAAPLLVCFGCTASEKEEVKMTDDERAPVHSQGLLLSLIHLLHGLQDGGHVGVQLVSLQ